MFKITPNLPNWYHVHLRQTDSTMEQIYRPIYEPEYCEFTVLPTDHQTEGHGQADTKWEANAEENLLFSFTFHPQGVDAEQIFSLSEALALAVRESLQKVTGLPITVKWPNDVYCGDRKICGMLLRHDLCGREITTTYTGVGINVNQSQFRSDAPNPVSVFQLTGRETNRAALLRSVLDGFERRYRQIQNGAAAELHREYMTNLYRGTGLHPFADNGGEFLAEIVDILPTGKLRLRREDGSEHEYFFKQVRFVLPSFQ